MKKGNDIICELFICEFNENMFYIIKNYYIEFTTKLHSKFNYNN